MAKFTVERDALTDALAWASRALPARPTAPVLAGLLITATEAGQLTIAAYDYETAATATIEGVFVEEPGSFILQGRMLADISKALPRKPVSFTLDGTRVQIRCGASKFNQSVMLADSYPALPAEPPVAGTVNAEDFAAAVSRVIIAASKDASVPLLSGVNVQIDGPRIVLYATDRYRLAHAELEWEPRDEAISAEFVIRTKALGDIAKNLSHSGTVTLAMDADNPTLIQFAAGGRRATTTRLDGAYPPVSRLFPELTPISAVIPRSALVDAVRRVAVVVDQNAPVRLAFSSEELTLSANSAEDSAAAEAIEAHLDGEDLEVSVRDTFLLDVLGVMATDSVRLSFTHPSKPAVLVGVDENGVDVPGYRHLIMPVRAA